MRRFLLLSPVPQLKLTVRRADLCTKYLPSSRSLPNHWKSIKPESQVYTGRIPGNRRSSELDRAV